MLEGNEIDKKFGSGGSVIVDVSADGKAKAVASWDEGGLKAGISIEVDVLEIVGELVKKSENKVDDKIYEMLKAALGR